MTWNECKIAMEKSIEIFDTIDFKPYLETSDTLSSLKYSLEDDYNYTPVTENDFMEGLLFNVFSDEEFIEYLEKRYPNVSFAPYTEYNINYDW